MSTTKQIRQCIEDAKNFCTKVDDVMQKLKQELPDEFYACSVQKNWNIPLHYKVKCFVYDYVDKQIKVVVEQLSKSKSADMLNKSYIISMELFEKYCQCKTFIQAQRVYESLLDAVYRSVKWGK